MQHEKRLTENRHQPQSLQASRCCLRGCLMQWSAPELASMRRDVALLGKTARRALLQKFLRRDQDSHLHCYLPKDANAVNDECVPDLILVCTKAFQNAFGVSTRQLYHVHDLSPAKGCRVNEKFLQAKAWLLEQKDIYEISPVASHIYVPYETRDVFFKIFQERHPDISKTTFENAWHSDECKMLKVRKWNPFPKCDECCLLREQLRQVRGDKDKTQKAVEKVKLHERFFRAEKHAYHERRLLAVRNKSKYVSIIVDGADQSLYDIPHMAVRSKFIVGRLRIPLKIMGVIVHGERSYGFGYTDNMSHGTNVVIQALHEALLDQLLIHGKLPENLLLQLDNTSSQNKNRYMVGYCALLIQCGIFKTIRISYLPVGHTHEDIDQLFSTLHRRLNRMNVLSRLDMATAFTEGFHRFGEMVQTFKAWDSVANMSDLLKPEIPELPGIMGFRQILIQKLNAQSCTVVAQFKQHAIENDDQFRGLAKSTAHTVILEDLVYIDSIPDCQWKCSDSSDIIVRHKEVWEIIRKYRIGSPHVADLKRCLQLLEGGRVLTCPWTGTDYNFYDQQWRENVTAMVCPPLRLKDPGVQIDHLYMIRPDHVDKHEFWVAKVLGFVSENDGNVRAIVQWYEAPFDFAVYEPTQRKSSLPPKCLRLRVHLQSDGRLRGSDVDAIHDHLLKWRNLKAVEESGVNNSHPSDEANEDSEYQEIDDDDKIYNAAKAERKKRLEEAKRKRREEKDHKTKSTRKRRTKIKDIGQ